MVSAETFRRGLVVGKFSPLHLGHELLIRRALGDCEHVTVISYSVPELPGCGPERREAWLNARFPGTTVLVLDDARLRALCRQQGLPAPDAIPHNDADGELHRHFVAWLLLAVLGRTVDAVFTSEEYGDGFAAVLARRFTDARGRAMAVRHVSVDPARVAVPVSGTRVRADPHGQKAFLAPPVYASFVRTVCLLGGESSGKTTLAQALAERLGTLWVAEYGRERWVAQDGILHYEDMRDIGAVQQRREDAMRPDANGWLVCDTSALTTLFYCRAMFDRDDAELARLAERRYDRVLLCAADFDFVQDGTRRDAAFSSRQHAWYVGQLARRGIPWLLLTGGVEARLDTALAWLKSDGSAG